MQSANAPVFSVSLYKDPRGISCHLLPGFCAASFPGHCTPAEGFDVYYPNRLTAAINPGEVKRNRLVCTALSLSWQTMIIKNRDSSCLKTHIEWELVDKIILGDQGINWFVLIKNTSLPHIKLLSFINSHLLFTFPWLFLFFLTPHRKSLKICEKKKKKAHFHPYFLNRQHCWGSGSGNQYVYPWMIASREAKGALGRTVSPRAVSLLFHPCLRSTQALRGSGSSQGHPPCQAVPERGLWMQAKPVGLHVLHQSSTGDWQSIWRTGCWSESAGGWHRVFITWAGVCSPAWLGVWPQHHRDSELQAEASLSLPARPCGTQKQPCATLPPLWALSHHEPASPLTQTLLSLFSTECGTNTICLVPFSPHSLCGPSTSGRHASWAHIMAGSFK